eukprot:CAMPEP_0197186322 /NCGR_PEP_ID=MMETSP1423-20130617/13694_1 /TAXON_ID=476441 /ORGANISM="Pseudo-nitzschia heimii, Strain UNC1101" /LENGTH=1057 /DNA_ID=CAMNT_0042637597 /DNA_START=98 /DNA_END=3271 /DNA_ORIENTATION=-
MLKPISVDENDETEENSGYQKQDFKDELEKLRSIIRTLSSTQKLENGKNGDCRKSSGRTFSIQKLRFRRTSKKEAVRDDVMDRVKKLKNICNDLSERLKADKAKHNDSDSISVMNSPQMEPKDNEISGREDNEVERVSADRTEILQAIKDCAKILSNFSVDPQSSKISMDVYQECIETIEMSESRFIESEFDFKPRDDLPKKATKTIDKIKMTESQFLESDEIEETLELQANCKEHALKSEEKLFERNEDPNQSTCYGFNDCWIIEAIENILTGLFANKNSGEIDGIGDTTENEIITDCLCGISQLWNDRDDEEQLQDENTLTEKEISNTMATSTVVTKSETSAIGHSKNSAELLVEESKLEAANKSTLKTQRAGFKEKNEAKNNNPIIEVSEDVEEEDKTGKSPTNKVDQDVQQKNNSDKTPVDEVDDLRKGEKSEDIGAQKRENSSGTEAEHTVSLDCGLFDSICSSKGANIEFDLENNLEPKGEIVTNPLDCAVFNSLKLTVRGETETDAIETSKENKQKEIPSWDSGSCNPAGSGEERNDNQLAMETESEEELKIIERIEAPCMSAILLVNKAPENVFEPEKQSEIIEMPQEQCVSAIANCIDAGLKIMDSASIEHRQTLDEERSHIGEKDERVLKTVTSMDFIPSIEVVGVKKPKKKAFQENTLEKTTYTTVAETEDSRDEIDGQQIRTVSTMDFIPRYEVVGFKKINNFDSGTESVDLNEQRDESEVDNASKGKSSGEGLAMTKLFFSRGEKSEFQTRKISQKEYRRMAARKRRERRRTKHLPKQLERSNGHGLVTIQEAPEHLEQASNDSINPNEKVTKFKVMHRDTPKTLVKKSLKESSPPFMVQGQVIKTAIDNSGFKIYHQDVRKAPSAVQLQQGTDDSMSAVTFAGCQQARHAQSPGYSHALIDVATSTSTISTVNKASMKGVYMKESKGRSHSRSGEKLPLTSPRWFFPSFKEEEEEDEIIECLSTVLSIPKPATFGTRIDNPTNEDNAYVNHYYDFGDEEIFDKDNEYHEYYDDFAYCDLYKDEEEIDKNGLYVCDSYREQGAL